MIHDHVQNQVDAAGVARRGECLQVGECAEMRSDRIEIARRVAVVLGIGIQHHG